MQSAAKTLILTGSNGFIGRHVKTALLKHNNIKCVTWSHKNKDFRTIPKADICIHLAARVHDEKDNICPSIYFKDNCDNTVTIAQELFNKGLKTFIFMSTVKIYGEKEGNYTETHTPNPTGSYAKSKYQAEFYYGFSH